MATVEAGIYTLLKNTAAITNVVSTRIRPLAAGQADARPFITYHVTDRKSDSTLAGEVDDYHTIEFEIGIYADAFDIVMDLSDAARALLDQNGQTVTVAGGTQVEFAPIMFDSETDVEETTPDGQEMPVYLRVQTYRALYRIVS